MTTYVLFIEFADDPPRVEVFDSLDEAEAILDAFEVTVFDPPLNDDLLALRHTFRARIFECKGVSLAFNYKRGDCSGWGTEVDSRAARKESRGEEVHLFPEPASSVP